MVDVVKPLGAGKCGGQLLLLKDSWAQRASVALLLVGVFGLAGCSAQVSEKHLLSVNATIEVCDGATCFVAPVQGATVTVVGGGHNATAETGSDGSAAFSLKYAGDAFVKVNWGSQSQSANAVIGADPSSVSVRFKKSAVVSS